MSAEEETAAAAPAAPAAEEEKAPEEESTAVFEPVVRLAMCLKNFWYCFYGELRRRPRIKNDRTEIMFAVAMAMDMRRFCSPQFLHDCQDCDRAW